MTPEEAKLNALQKTIEFLNEGEQAQRLLYDQFIQQAKLHYHKSEEYEIVSQLLTEQLSATLDDIAKQKEKVRREITLLKLKMAQHDKRAHLFSRYNKSG